MVAAMIEDDEERMRLRPLSAFALALGVVMSGAILYNTLLGGAGKPNIPGSASLVIDAGDGNARVVTMRYEPMVEKLQRDLKQLGRYDGPADGVIGKRTRQAIMAFQRENDLAPDGEPTEELLDKVAFQLRIAEAAGFTATTASAPDLPDATVRKIQEKLAELGYEPGALNGLAGEQTHEAIANFERDRGLEPKGEPSPKILAELEAMTEAARATAD